MELLDEIRASRKVGFRMVDTNRGGWEDMGLQRALKHPSLIARYKKTMRFVTESADIEKLKRSSILDAGEYNPFSQWLKDNFGILVHNTPPEMDLDHCYNKRIGNDKFDYVFAFEILEHLMNPLAFLESIVSSLKDNGIVFLSTPFLRPRFLWSKYHITEYFPDKVEIMAKKAGLAVRRYKRVNVCPRYLALTGIRPFFRALRYERIMLFEFSKTIS